MEFINCKVEEEKKAWALIDAGYDGSFTGVAYGSVFFQNSNNSVRVTDDFMRAVLDDGEWQTQGGDRRRGDGHLQGARPDAADRRRHVGVRRSRACSSTPPSTSGTPARTRDRINASNPCSEYMFLDDSACNLSSINLMKFVKDDGEFDVAAFKAACRTMITAQEIIVAELELPDEGDREELARLSSARSRLREPRRAADVARPAVRQRRGARVCGGDHGGDDRRGVRAVGADRARPRRAVRRLREEPRAVPARDAQAPRGGRARSTRSSCRPISTPARSRRGTRPSSSARTSATATRRRPCWRRPAPSAS